MHGPKWKFSKKIANKIFSFEFSKIKKYFHSNSPKYRTTKVINYFFWVNYPTYVQFDLILFLCYPKPVLPQFVRCNQ